MAGLKDATRGRPRSRLSGRWLTLTAFLLVSAPAQAATPNIEGVWKLAAPTTSLAPVGGAIPFTPEGRKHYEKNKTLRAARKYDDYDITLSRCSSPGVPRLMITPDRFKIWYRQQVVDFDFEWNRAARAINVGAETQPDMMGGDLVPSMTGKSNGHWEGDTLVAVTTNLSDATLIDDLVPHTQDMKVTERIRLVDSDTLENRITIEDPAYFSRPWDAVVTYKRQPDAIFPEDVCLDRIQARQPAFPAR